MGRQFTLKTKTGTMLYDVSDNFPKMGEDDLAVLLFTGGIDSYMCATLAKELYGIDKIVFVFLTMTSAMAVNEDKLKRVKQDFFDGIKRIGATKHIIIDKNDLTPYDTIDNIVLNVIRKKYTASNYYGIIPHGVVQFQSYDLLKDAGYHTGKYTNNEIELYFNDHKEDYPELSEYITTFGGKLYWLDNNYDPLSFTDRTRMFESSNFPFRSLNTSMIVQMYNDMNILDELYKTTTCNETKYDYSKNSHCGTCKNCKERKSSFIKAGVIDKTDYKE